MLKIYSYKFEDKSGWVVANKRGQIMNGEYHQTYESAERHLKALNRKFNK